MIRLNPEILDRAVELTGSRSDDQLGQAFLNLTGTTIRNYRAGKSMPTVVTLARLKKITGIPLDQMVIETKETTTAHAA
ncbi:hypothetical protein [Corynebacterium flavescens]|uniref:hypothetical protein n=1 Tax=Corynebacterium flavescens TaxID=28028 RepID=UPI002896B573|nr:hypothetical protein [Corynebacterium flavescens]